MKVTIKEIKIKDIDLYFDFFRKTVESEFDEFSKADLEYVFNRGWSKKQYSDWFKNNKRFILGALIDKELIGVLDAQSPDIGVCFCSWLMVDKKYQKKGIGTMLLKKMEQIMKKKGVHMLYLYASPHNIPYYKKIGYEYVGNMRKVWFGQDHHIFTKQIQKPKEKNYLK